MMRHLHFVQSLEPRQGGGLGRAAQELHTQFLADGEKSLLVATRAKEFKEAWPEVVQHARIGPQKLYYAPKLNATADLTFPDIDIVHGHGFYVGTNYIFGRKARHMHKPLVYHVHGIFEPWILRRSRLKKYLAKLWFENANFRHASLWRALTGKEADQIRAVGIKAPIVIAPNGIDLAPFDKFQEEAGSKGEQKGQCVFLGRLHPKKGLDLLLNAWSVIGKIKEGWKLIIAGPNENGYQSKIEQYIHGLGLHSSVSLAGTITGTEKTRLLKRADLFILPSYSEGFSVAILEALACKVPVIATTACNFPELARSGGGWECESSIESVAKTLSEAMESSIAERKERGALGRRLVEKSYTWQEVAATILEACRSLHGSG